MKIAFIIPRICSSAPIQVVKAIANGLCDLIGKDNIEVFYLKKSVVISGFNCKVTKLTAHDFFNPIRLNDFDIIHSHGFSADIFSFYISLVTRKKSCIWLSTLHQFNYQSFFSQSGNRLFSYVVSRFWEYILGRSHSVIALSKSMKNYYENRIGSNVVYIYNGLDFKTGESSGKTHCSSLELSGFGRTKSRYYVVGCVSRLVEIKRLDLVIKAVADIEDLVAIFIGDGDKSDQLKELAKSLNVTNRCVFLGFVNQPYEYYKLFDSYILASDSEGFPLSLLEACAFECDIICSDIAICTEIFDDTEVTFFNKGDYNSLKTAIRSRQDDSQGKGFFANQKYRNYYTMNSMIDNHYNFYLSICNVRSVV